MLFCCYLGFKWRRYGAENYLFFSIYVGQYRKLFYRSDQVVCYYNSYYLWNKSQWGKRVSERQTVFQKVLSPPDDRQDHQIIIPLERGGEHKESVETTTLRGHHTEAWKNTHLKTQPKWRSFLTCSQECGWSHIYFVYNHFWEKRCSERKERGGWRPGTNSV